MNALILFRIIPIPFIEKLTETMCSETKDMLTEALERGGLRWTRQREHVFEVLLKWRDHPTADEVFVRTREVMPSISLATVYNCLETLVQCGLVRTVHKERESTRYCPNLREHAHFCDKVSGRMFDVDLPHEVLEQLKSLLPKGYEAESVELYFHGHASAKE